MKLIEEALFSSWPALEEEKFNGWSLRFANGYTKRANSANLSAPKADLSLSDLKHIEAFYRDRGEKSIFRLLSSNTSDATDHFLIENGYRFADHSIVMTAPLGTPSTGCEITRFENVPEWLKIFDVCMDSNKRRNDMHQKLLDRIQDETAYAVLMDQGKPISCGLAVIHGTLLGLYDIVTAPQYRGKGYANKLCSGLMNWGLEQGATSTYLQVVGGNNAAINLYEKLGFRQAYHYWYRIKTFS